MATIRPFQVNNGLEVNLNANVTNVVSASDFLQEFTPPTNTPSLVFNFAQSTTLDSRISFSRPSTATFFASNGFLAYANSNIPRFETINGISRGLLIEEQRTNIYWASTVPEQSVRQNPFFFSLTPYVANTTAPDGTNTAIIVSNYIDQNSNITPPRDNYAQNQVYTKTVFAKLIAGSSSLFSQIILTGSYIAVANFNLATGAATTSDANSRVSMTSVGNNWWRCAHTFRTDTSFNAIGDSFFIGGYGSTSTPTQMALWGWQSEIGNEMTSLIPTPTTGSATRAADVVTVPINANATWYNALSGTCYGEYTTLTQGRASFGGGYQPGYPQIFGMVGRDPNNEVMSHFQAWVPAANSLGGSTTGQVNFLNFNNPTNASGIFTNVDTNLSPLVTLNIGSTVRAAFSYSTNNMIYGANGVVGTTSYVNANPTMTNLFLMQSARFQVQPSGHFKKFVYYPSRMTSAQIQYITLPIV